MEGFDLGIHVCSFSKRCFFFPQHLFHREEGTSASRVIHALISGADGVAVVLTFGSTSTTCLHGFARVVAVRIMFVESYVHRMRVISIWRLKISIISILFLHLLLSTSNGCASCHHEGIRRCVRSLHASTTGMGLRGILLCSFVCLFLHVPPQIIEPTRMKLNLDNSYCGIENMIRPFFWST